jgi:excinuclease ABC subunit C
MEAGVKQQVQHFPESPGVYQFFNAENTLIYVGKAKNLKKELPATSQKAVASVAKHSD